MNWQKRSTATKYALSFTGTFYKWGGDDPSGFDCSGLVVELLKAVGILKRGSDYTAAQLSAMFPEVQKPARGCLACYGNPVTHIEYCIDKYHTIGASGGGSATRTIEDAIRQNAFIKIRPVRKGRYVDPFR
jgi:hypothetical protein